MADVPPYSSSSARVKKRQRQRANHQKRSYAYDAFAVLCENPTFGNALRAWLAHIEKKFSEREYKSAYKFARALRSFSSRGSGNPDYAETSRISVDTLSQWADDLAWSLNVKFTLSDDAGSLKTPTSRIGINLRSFILFLGQTRIFTRADVDYLLNECESLEEDLDRTSKINRIMEEYTLYIQEAYFDAGRTVDETYQGEYEVEGINDRRLLILRRYNPEESDSSSTSPRTFATYFPMPLVELVKPGDTLTLQICHLEQNRVWVPYMYSGVTPSRDDGGTETPTERRMRSSSTQMTEDAVSTLQQSLRRLDILSRSGSSDRDSKSRRGARTRTESALRLPPQMPGFDFNFDESKYTDAYFRSWDGDIDTDEDFNDIVRPPNEEPEERGIRGGNSSGVNLYHALKERHS